MTSPQQSPSAARQHARQVIVDYAQANDLVWQLGQRDGELVLALPGDHKAAVVVSLLVGERAVSVTSFVIRNPDENHEALYRRLLRANLQLPGVGYAIDELGDVYLRGRLPVEGLGERALDELLGVVHTACDGVFDELLVLGFGAAMQREWDWRVDRGESTANLAAFRSLLERGGQRPARAESDLADPRNTTREEPDGEP